MTLLLFACVLCLHLSFLWARFAYFRIDGPTHVGVRVIEVAGSASALSGMALILTRHGASVWGDSVALLVAALSAGLFAWGVHTVQRRQLTAAFSIDVPAELVTSGAFRCIRNPFYASYLLAHAMRRIVDADDPATSPIFGDAATATVVLARNGCNALATLRRPVLSAQADTESALQVPLPGKGQYVCMDGKRIFAVAIKRMAEMLERAGQQSRLAVADMDLIVPHQANGRMIEASPSWAQRHEQATAAAAGGRIARVTTNRAP